MESEEKSVGNIGLPFGLCSKLGIVLPAEATPREAWEAIKKETGYSPDEVYRRISSNELKKFIVEKTSENQTIISENSNVEKFGIKGRLVGDGYKVAVSDDPLVVADWVAKRAFKEKKGSGIYDTRVLAIIGSTDKAYNVMLGGLFDFVTTWVPKSQTSVDKDNNVINNEDYSHSTYLADSFDDALTFIKSERKMFR